MTQRQICETLSFPGVVSVESGGLSLSFPGVVSWCRFLVSFPGVILDLSFPVCRSFSCPPFCHFRLSFPPSPSSPAKLPWPISQESQPSRLANLEGSLGRGSFTSSFFLGSIPLARLDTTAGNIQQNKEYLSDSKRSLKPLTDTARLPMSRKLVNQQSQ